MKPETENRRKGVRGFVAIAIIGSLLALTACDVSEVQQFKTYWSGGVNAVDSFSSALQANPNVSADLKAKVKKLASKLDPTKPFIQSLTTFPPENRQELADLLKEVLPVLQDISGDSQVGTTISIAASVAVAFFQTEADMLDASVGPPAGAAGAPANPSVRLPELKTKLHDFKKAVKAIK